MTNHTGGSVTFRVETIGDATLYLGDCAEVMASWPECFRVDAVVTDPPYGIGFAAQPTRYQRANGMVAQAWDDVAPQGLVEAAVGKADVAIVWGGQYFSFPPSRGWLIWSKTGNAPSMSDVEMAWTSIDMNARSFEKSVKSSSLEKNLQTAAHPSQKPLALMEWCLGFLPGARTILDPFMGSGTTGVACVKSDRAFIGIEREPAYFDIACRRIGEAYKQPRLFAEPTPKPTQSTLSLEPSP